MRGRAGWRTRGQPNRDWPGLLDSTNQTLTPNPDLIYAMPFFNTMDAGPIVLEVQRPANVVL